MAESLMKQSQRAMHLIYGADLVTLHVRVSNGGARRLYGEALGFETGGVEAKYYADGEDACAMSKKLTRAALGV